jgi:hypothetical protein
MRDVRANLAAGRFSTFKNEFLADYPIIPHQVRAANREKRRSRIEGQKSNSLR